MQRKWRTKNVDKWPNCNSKVLRRQIEQDNEKLKIDIMVDTNTGKNKS